MTVTTLDDEVVAEVIDMTPALAEQLLALNTNNRVIRQNRVASYANQMKRGEWRFTGEAIQKNGNVLLNGQHRLLACVSSGVTFKVVLVSGIASGAMRVMDSGLPRAASDALRAEGLHNVNALASVSRMVLGWQRGYIRDTTRMSREISRTDVCEFATANNDVVQWAVLSAKRVTASVGLPTSHWATALYLIHVADNETGAAVEFVNSLIEGALLAKGDAVFALRSWAISSVTQRRRRSSIELVAVTIKAWNAWIASQPIGLLKFLPAEPLPVADKAGLK